MNRKSRISLCVTITLAAFLVGCTDAELARAQTDEQVAERLYAATTQATATAKAALDGAPSGAVNTPAYQDARRVVDAAEKAQQAARAGLDLAKATIDAVANHDPTDPALISSLTKAVNQIPSPWAVMLASLIPAALPLAVSVAQAFKLGQARSAVQQVTQQLDEHKAALAKLTTPGEVKA